VTRHKAAGLGAAVGRGRSLGDLYVESTGGALLIAYRVVLIAAAVIADRAARNVSSSREIPHAT